MKTNKYGHTFADDSEENGYYPYGPFVEAKIRNSDVRRIVHYRESVGIEGYYSRDVMAVFITNDGRWAFFEAWCDTTGWDCKAGASAIVYAKSEKALVPELTAEARRAFGYEETPGCRI